MRGDKIPRRFIISLIARTEYGDWFVQKLLFAPCYDVKYLLHVEEAFRAVDCT